MKKNRTQCRKLLSAFVLIYMAWMLFSYSLDPLSMAVGAVVSLAIALVSMDFLFRKSHLRVFNPRRWLYFLAFLGLMLYQEARGHLCVSYMIITGRTRPGIVRVPLSLESDVSKTMVLDSITVSPGTVAVSLRDSSMFIHCLDCSQLPRSRMAERIIKGVCE